MLLVVAALMGTSSAAGDGSVLRKAQQIAPAAIVVSPSGDDASCARRAAARPCASFQRAYALAQCGDAIDVAGGAYPTQVVVEVARLNACRQPVTFRARQASRPHVDGSIRLGSCQGCFSTDAPSNLIYRGLSYSTSFDIWGDARNIVLDRMSGGGLLLEGPFGVIVRNSNFGPCASSGPGSCERIFVLSGTDAITSNVLLENNVIHDFTIAADGDHWECVFATGGRNVTIRGNRFDNCQTYHIRLVKESPTDEIVNWRIEDNRFGKSANMGGGARSSAIVLGTGGTSTIGATIRNNTFIAGQGVVHEGGPDVSSVLVDRNILTNTSCLQGVRYRANLWVGAKCSPEDRLGAFGYRFDGSRLRVDAAQARAVREAFRLVATGHTATSTARSLARGRFAAPGRWTASSVRRLLTDDIYLGRRLGRQAEHAPLVSAARWKAVQRALKRS